MQSEAWIFDICDGPVRRGGEGTVFGKNSIAELLLSIQNLYFRIMIFHSDIYAIQLQLAIVDFVFQKYETHVYAIRFRHKMQKG